MDPSQGKPVSSIFSRVIKYLVYRAALLFFMVCAGVFLAIVIINYGGYIDKIHRADIDEALSTLSLSMRGATHEEVVQQTELKKWAMEEAYGLHKPFLLRCVKWFYQAMTFDWGISYRIGIDRFSGEGKSNVTAIVLARIPYTLLLAGSTNIILFFAGIFLALYLANRYESFLDRLIILLSPLSSIPNWVYGILLTVIFAGELHLLPFGGLYDTFPPATKLGYVPIVLKHMILPVTAIFLGMFFSAAYSWRTFFLIHAGEDYLEMAKAKGVPARLLKRRYMLRPTLPYIITSFAVMLITFWQGIIVLEVFFAWPGLGKLFMTAISLNETAVTIGIMVSFAFLLAISVFLLDIIYVLVDPRVRIGTRGQTAQPAVLEKQYRGMPGALKRLIQPLEFLGLGAVGKSKQLGVTRAPAIQLSKPTRPLPAAATASRLSGSAGGKSETSPKYCPHLKIANGVGYALQASPNHCRCFVRQPPERIANLFQAEVCRTEGYWHCPRLQLEAAPSQGSRRRIIPARRVSKQPKASSDTYSFLREFKRYPLAVTGVMVILGLVAVSIYTVIAIPYQEAIDRWSGDPSRNRTLIPAYAMPVWVNLFRKDPLPPTIIQDSQDGTATKMSAPTSSGVIGETITYTVPFPYGDFPQDLVILFYGQYIKKPFVSLTWSTPDGRQFELGNFSVVAGQRFVASQEIPGKYLDKQTVSEQNFLLTGVGGPRVVEVLFKNPAIANQSVLLKGTYTLRIDGVLFEPGSTLDARMILYGKVYGLAGTDNLRRDLMVALLWGTPVALAFGFFGAITSGVLSMLIAAIGVWYGGWVDNVVQRLTEVNMILPTLPIAITVYYLYSKSIWIILGIIILLSIFGSVVKTYRAAFLQAREMPYIEAAQAYGASNRRIVWRYLVPRIIPLLIPQMVILVPSYVFFEATLAYLKVSDPTLPTWGKVVYDALTQGAYKGDYYWVLEPVALIILTALAFAVVGFALDSILNPRLRRF